MGEKPPRRKGWVTPFYLPGLTSRDARPLPWPLAPAELLGPGSECGSVSALLAVSRSPLGELSCHCREVTKDGALAVPLFTGPRVLGDAVGRVGTVGEKHGGVVVDIRGMSHGKWGQQAPAF